jgi:hypothetical protein
VVLPVPPILNLYTWLRYLTSWKPSSCRWNHPYQQVGQTDVESLLHNPVTNIVHQLRPQCGSWWVMQMLHILRSVELVCWILVSLMHTSRNIMLEMPPCFSRWKLRWLLLVQSCVIPVKCLKPSTNSVTIQELWQSVVWKPY